MRTQVVMLSLIGSLATACVVEPLAFTPIDAGSDADRCVSAPETCDGTDEDCDGAFDEGFASNAPCDGPDLDQCLDDMMVCGDSGEVCGDTSGADNLELCNGPGLDEDCDGNVDEGFGVAAPCDGSDGDSCAEGVNACSPDGLGVVCSDATGTIAETCDKADEDCDGHVDESFNFENDEANCGNCGITCDDVRADNSCVLGRCAAICDAGSAQCNNYDDDGCELVATNPLCSATSSTADYSVNGDDDGVTPWTVTGTTERFIRVRVRENDNGSATNLRARFVLVSGAGTDFDLFVYCTPDCTATPQSAPNDLIEVGRAEATGSGTFDQFIEIRYDPTTPSTSCEPWTLTITGNVGAGGAACPG